MSKEGAQNVPMPAGKEADKEARKEKSGEGNESSSRYLLSAWAARRNSRGNSDSLANKGEAEGKDEEEKSWPTRCPRLHLEDPTWAIVKVPGQTKSRREG